jgi:hypothetical protein
VARDREVEAPDLPPAGPGSSVLLSHCEPPGQGALSDHLPLRPQSLRGLATAARGRRPRSPHHPDLAGEERLLGREATLPNARADSQTPPPEPTTTRLCSSADREGSRNGGFTPSSRATPSSPTSLPTSGTSICCAIDSHASSRRRRADRLRSGPPRPSQHRVEPRLRSRVGSAAKQGDQQVERSREIAAPI